MHKSQIALLGLLFMHCIAYAGIYRHDRKESDYVALGAQAQFNCVGQVFHNGKMGASCVLINSKHVLCAAHVFIEASYRQDTINNKDGQLILNTPYNQHVGNAADYSVVFNGKEYKCHKLTVYPGYLDTATKDGLDMAIMELDAPINDIAPAVLSAKPNELHADVTGVGWGVYGRADKASEVGKKDGIKKLGGENVIDSLGGYVLHGMPTAMYCDFDHPTDTTCNKMGSAMPRNLEYISGGGDSGGGLFRQTKGGWQLVGVCHGGSTNIPQLIRTGYYGQVMCWMRVSVFADWIKQNEL